MQKDSGTWASDIVTEIETKAATNINHEVTGPAGTRYPQGINDGSTRGWTAESINSHEVTSLGRAEIPLYGLWRQSERVELPVDFAVLFDFGDNDFGLAMEGGAKAYCDEFNCILRQIDLYNDQEYSWNDYIGDFNELYKVDWHFRKTKSPQDVSPKGLV